MLLPPVGTVPQEKAVPALPVPQYRVDTCCSLPAWGDGRTSEPCAPPGLMVLFSSRSGSPPSLWGLAQQAWRVCLRGSRPSLPRAGHTAETEGPGTVGAGGVGSASASLCPRLEALSRDVLPLCPDASLSLSKACDRLKLAAPGEGPLLRLWICAAGSEPSLQPWFQPGWHLLTWPSSSGMWAVPSIPWRCGSSRAASGDFPGFAGGAQGPPGATAGCGLVGCCADSGRFQGGFKRVHLHGHPKP